MVNDARGPVARGTDVTEAVGHEREARHGVRVEVHEAVQHGTAVEVEEHDGILRCGRENVLIIGQRHEGGRLQLPGVQKSGRVNAPHSDELVPATEHALVVGCHRH